MSEHNETDHPGNGEPKIPATAPGDSEHITGNNVEAGGEANRAADANRSDTNKSISLDRFMLKRFPNATQHDRWTLIFTAVIAFSTLAYTLVAGYTLIEIHSGSTDTHNLAIAAAQQASHTEEIAQAAQDQVDAANEISDAADEFSNTSATAVEEFKIAARNSSAVAGKQADAAVKAAESAKTQAMTMQTTLESNQQQFRTEQRPLLWANPRGGFKPEGKDKTDIDWTVFIGQPDGSALMGVAVEFRNGGKSPAVHVISTSTTYIINQAAKAQIAARNYIPDYRTIESGAIAPGSGMVPASPTLLITKEQAAGYTDGSWEIYVVGAVRYSDIFSPPLKETYETTYCWRVLPVGMAFGECSFGKPYFGGSIK